MADDTARQESAKGRGLGGCLLVEKAMRLLGNATEQDGTDRQHDDVLAVSARQITRLVSTRCLRSRPELGHRQLDSALRFSVAVGPLTWQHAFR
jgi:hypothetical protein